jgi:uncharacterized protein (TIGR02145 family)
MNNQNKLLNYIKLIVVIFSLLHYGCKKNNEDKSLNISTINVREITKTSATVKGNLSSSYSDYMLSKGISWSNIIVNPTVEDHYVWGGTGNGEYNSNIKNLTPGTKYYARAFAKLNGTCYYGNSITFSTAGNITGDIGFNQGLSYGTIKDADGNTYKTIKIGNQTWMAENLKTSKYNDSTDIPSVTDISEWVKLATSAYSWYLNDEEKFKKTYGALYNWHSVNTGKLCPTGWHVPGKEEWETLINYLGGENTAGGKLLEADSIHWIKTTKEITNSSGFTALPGGYRCGRENTTPHLYFESMGYQCAFWTSTSFKEDDNYSFSYGTGIINQVSFLNAPNFKNDGKSVRCIRDL